MLQLGRLEFSYWPLATSYHTVWCNTSSDGVIVYMIVGLPLFVMQTTPNTSVMCACGECPTSMWARGSRGGGTRTDAVRQIPSVITGTPTDPLVSVSRRLGTGYALKTYWVIYGWAPFPSPLLILLNWSGLPIHTIISTCMQLAGSGFVMKALKNVCAMIIGVSQQDGTTLSHFWTWIHLETVCTLGVLNDGSVSSVFKFRRLLRLPLCGIIRVSSWMMTGRATAVCHMAALELVKLALIRFLVVAESGAGGTTVVIAIWVIVVVT